MRNFCFCVLQKDENKAKLFQITAEILALTQQLEKRTIFAIYSSDLN